MIPPPPFIDELQQKARSFIDSTPIRDVEKNARTWFDSTLAQWGGVPRTEMTSLSLLVEKMSERITQLEKRIVALEKSPS